MEIKVLGTGCPKCKVLEKSVRDVVADLKLNATITKVEDIVDIMSYGILSTPALVIDDKIVVKGRVPSSEEIKEFLSKS